MNKKDNLRYIGMILAIALGIGGPLLYFVHWITNEHSEAALILAAILVVGAILCLAQYFQSFAIRKALQQDALDDARQWKMLAGGARQQTLPHYPMLPQGQRQAPTPAFSVGEWVDTTEPIEIQ